MSKPRTTRSLSTKGGNDRVMTPDSLAYAIVEHFSPAGVLLDPCQGTGAFFRAFARWAEKPNKGQGIYIDSYTGSDIDQGHDFLARPVDDDPAARVDWIITNPPWSLFRPFLNMAMKQANNVVFLDKWNAWGFNGRLADIKAAGFHFERFAIVPPVPKPWPQMGLALAAVHIQRAGLKSPGWMGRAHVDTVPWTPPPPGQCLYCGREADRRRGICDPCKAAIDCDAVAA